MAVLGARRAYDPAGGDQRSASTVTSLTTPISTLEGTANDLRSKYDRMRHVFAAGGRGVREVDTPLRTMPNIVAAEMVKSRSRVDTPPRAHASINLTPTNVTSVPKLTESSKSNSKTKLNGWHAYMSIAKYVQVLSH